MNSEPVSKEQIFNLAAEVEDPDQQRQLLEDLCGNDGRLRAEIEDLLSQDAKLGNFLEPPNENRTGPTVDTVTLKSDDTLNGSTIGNYQIQEVIGRGGMGAVYLARQSQPIKRKVALKVIRAGLDSRNVLARFAAERQALALMNHPNIARIVDVGTTDGGQPWFAMELVQGPPITKYCDDNRLSIEDRLRLFVDVCSGVQHAHQKGIIHRDLKPSNILVALADGRPVPKVIDFGLAKALKSTQRLTDESLHTQIGQIVGTLKYMSPEQATLDLIDIDTRTDIYSLGVVLYELLTGSTPLDDDTLSHKSVLEVLELIREEDPVKPSRRLTSSGDRASKITQQRCTDSGSLNRILIGDLDWVVTKALEKDRQRRYETADALADDVHRFLNNEPIKARPPSTGYKVGKFVRKNRGLVTAVATIATLLFAATIVSGWFAYDASVARKDAEQKAEQSRIDKLAAEKSAKRSRGALQIFTDSFRSADPFQGAAMLAKDVLFKAQRGLESSDLDAEGRAKMFAALSESFGGIGEYEAAVDAATEQFGIQTSRHGPRHRETLISKSNLANFHLHAGRHTAALAIIEETLAARRVELGEDHLDTLASMNLLAVAYEKTDRLEEALPLFEKVLARRKKKLGHNNSLTLESMNNLAAAYDSAGRLTDATHIYEEAVESARNTLGGNNIRTFICMNNLAVAYTTAGRYKEALELMEKSLPETKSRLGADHPHTLTQMMNYSMALKNVGRLREAVPIMEEVVEGRRKRLGVDHPKTLASMDRLAGFFRSIGGLRKALPLLEQTLAYRTKKLGDEHTDTLESKNSLALLYLSTGQYLAAVPLLEQTLSARKEKLGDEHPETVKSMGNLGAAYFHARRLGDALRLMKQSVAVSTRTLGEDHPSTLARINNYAMALQSSDQIAEVLPLLEQTLAATEAKLGDMHPDTLSSMSNLAYGYFKAGQTSKAVELGEQALLLRKSELGPDHPDTLTTMNNLALSYADAGRTDDAIALGEKVIELSKRNLEANHPKTIKSMANLAKYYSDSGLKDKALALYEQVLIFNESNLGTKHPATRSTMVKLAKLLLAKNPERATDLLTQVFDHRRSADPEAWTTYNAQSLLGEAFSQLGELEKAKRHLVESFAGLKRTADDIPAAGRSIRLREAVDRLIALAEKADDQEALKKWQKAKDQLPS